MNVLPRIRYQGVDYFFDERLSELREVSLPWVNIPLKDYEVMWIKCTGNCPSELTHFFLRRGKNGRRQRPTALRRG